jgi:hypothetical protein
MRIALIGVLLSFAARQAVALTDCCCQAFCRNPNEPCEEHDHAPRPAKSDCCKDESSKPEPQPCTHLSPSSEVLKDDPSTSAAPVVLSIEPADVARAAVPESRASDGPVVHVRGSPPLHLRNHVLLI